MSRIAISADERKEIWNRFNESQSITDIAQYLKRSYVACHDTVKSNGGIKPYYYQPSILHTPGDNIRIKHHQGQCCCCVYNG